MLEKWRLYQLVKQCYFCTNFQVNRLVAENFETGEQYKQQPEFDASRMRFLFKFFPKSQKKRFCFN